MASTQATPTMLTPVDLTALRNRLATFCGVYLDDSRTAALEAAVRRRAEAVGRPPDAYVRELEAQGDRAELQRLAELLLNHETQFFRNRPHMRALREVVLPELHQRLPPGLPLRLWSAGCATGEEAYSLAISAIEALGDPLPRPVEVLACDLSVAALARARAGSYRGRSLANLSAQQRSRFFVSRGDSLQVTDQLRRLVHFEQLNLLDPFPPRARGSHVIFCQNVTIYFDVGTCRALMERFYEAIEPGGYLFLGFSETLWNIFNGFRWREIQDAYVYYKEPPNRARAGEPSPRPTPAVEARAVRRERATGTLGVDDTLVDRGRALLDAGQAEAALELFNGAPLVGPHAPQILALAARAHADRGDLDLALAEARRALALNPLTTAAHLLIGLIYARQGRYTGAIAQLQQARYLDGASPLIAYQLAECLRLSGRRESALREYRAALSALAAYPPTRVIDGVAVSWLSETCRRYVALLSGEALP